MPQASKRAARPRPALFHAILIAFPVAFPVAFLVAFLVATAGLLGTPSAHASKPAPVPDWMRQAANVPLPHLRLHDAAVVLLDQTDIVVDPQGHATVHERKVIKLLSAAGHNYATYPLYYQIGSKVHYLRSWTLGADEHPYQLDDKDILDASAVPSYFIFDSARVRVARALAAEPGAIVAFESEYEQAPYLTSWIYPLDQEIPSAAQSVTLTLPPGFTYRDAWAHTAPVKPQQLAPNTWQWQIGPRASLDDETAAPQLGEVSARMLLAYSGGPVPQADGSWSTVGTWYAGLSAGRNAPSPEITAEVAELTAGKTAFTDKLLAITGFMQDQIRYVAVEMGIGGWQPHPAKDVFRNRYGDCKDKATLLTSMLAAAGIEAYPVMVDFDHRVDPAMPTHFADHMITAIVVPPDVQDPSLWATIEVAGKRLLIFDPTNNVSPAGSLEPELQGTYGLLLNGSSSVPIQLPILPAQANILVRQGSFTLASDGSLTGEVTEERQGNTADVLRHIYLDGDTKKFADREEHIVRRSLSNFTLTDLSAEHARDRSLPLQIHFHLAVNGYAKHAGNLLLVRPSVVGVYQAAEFATDKPRDYPIALGLEEDLREAYTIQLPPGFKADDLPDPVEIKSTFADFHTQVTLTDGALHSTRELTIRRMEVPASAMAEYKDFFAKVAAAERDEALLKQ
jgi:transglutaminase-like putative cysteine protease